MVSKRRIAVAGLVVEFSGDSDAAAIIDRRYTAFFPELQGIAADHEVHAKVELALYATPEDPWAGGEVVDIESKGDEILLRGPGLQATIKQDASAATLRAPCNQGSIDGILRYLLSQLLLQRGGLLVHASAVLHNGRAWVFAGASGSGKSTLAKLLPGPCLGDEAIALLPSGGCFKAHATPYWHASPRSAEIAALVFHKQGTTNELCPISPSRAVAKLVSCTGPLLPHSMALAMERAETIVMALTPAVLGLELDSKAAIESWLPKQMASYGSKISQSTRS